MRKLILFLFLVPLLLSFNKIGNSEVYRTAKIDIVLTSKGGCKVHIKGTVKYTIIPPAIESFSGTVSISGNEGCVNTVLTLAKSNENEANPEVTVDFDREDVCSVSRIIWHSDAQPEIAELLNDNSINLGIIRILNSLCND